MKKLNKILIIPIILACSIFSISLADDSDCWKFWSLVYSNEWSFKIVDLPRWTDKNKFTNFLTIEEQNNIITKDDLNTAILNLKKYCCDNDKKWGLTDEICTRDKNFFNDNVPDSPYLFDHIFDVIMRRLNWQSGDINIYTKTKMSLDDKWTKRREFIDSQAEATGWSNPETIIAEYWNLWTQNEYNIAQKIYNAFWYFNNEDFLTYVSWKWGTEDSKSIANSFKKYDDWTLYERYINACALSEYFYALLDYWVDSTDKSRVISNLSNLSCNDMVLKTINWENRYVSLVTQRSSNLFLSNYVEWYFSYLNERQQRLLKLRKDSKDRRSDVAKAVPCLQRQCVKW